MEKVCQEFYCGECASYFRVKLNMALNQTVRMVCPGCSHEHTRTIKAGLIYDKGGESDAERIFVPKSALSKEPITAKMKKAKHGARDGAVIASEVDLVREGFLSSLWSEFFGG